MENAKGDVKSTHVSGSVITDNHAWLTESKPIPLTALNDPILEASGIELSVARLDLVDPLISGNKWFKLKYNLIEALAQGASHIVSFGGAYSNHLHALAAACHRLDLKSTAILRGELITPLNPTLSDCNTWGMNFRPVTRAQYREKATPQFIQQLKNQLGAFYLVPEGGSNVLAVKGMSEVAEIIIQNADQYDYLCAPVGSGGTLAGLVAGAKGAIKCIGYSAIKGGQYIEEDIRGLLCQYQRDFRLGEHVDDSLYSNEWVVDINHDYHFGGFAKTKPELMSFAAWFEQCFSIPLEHVYTAKMFYGLFDQIKAGRFKPGQRIVALHTGGLQGLRGIGYP